MEHRPTHLQTKFKKGDRVWVRSHAMNGTVVFENCQPHDMDGTPLVKIVFDSPVPIFNTGLFLDTHEATVDELEEEHAQHQVN